LAVPFSPRTRTPPTAGETEVSSRARRRSSRPTTAENGYGVVTRIPSGGCPRPRVGCHERPEFLAPGSTSPPALRARADSPVTVAGPSRIRTGFLRYRSPVTLPDRPCARQRGVRHGRTTQLPHTAASNTPKQRRATATKIQLPQHAETTARDSHKDPAVAHRCLKRAETAVRDSHKDPAVSHRCLKHAETAVRDSHEDPAVSHRCLGRPETAVSDSRGWGQERTAFSVLGRGSGAIRSSSATTSRTARADFSTIGRSRR
jgi:hypothetical protein